MLASLTLTLIDAAVIVRSLRTRRFGLTTFFRETKEMRKHLNEGQIVIHPSIIAELALGSLQERTKTLALLDLFCPRCEWRN